MNDLPETENNWANAVANEYKDPEENMLIHKTGYKRSFIKWYSKQIGKSKLSKADLEGPAFKLIDLVNLEGNRVVSEVSKPLSLGGPPSQVTIQPQYFFNKDLEYLVSGDKERMNALSISKLKAAYYPDFGLEELVPSLANYKEYKISEADFKNLHPNDIKDLYLLHLQGKLNHLFGADKNGVTRPKKYSELSATEAIQANCDIKATNIILQDYQPEVYALVSNQKGCQGTLENFNFSCT
ncbi:hypothetical protein Tco_0713781 [Tanacetum coccineum]